MTHRAVQAAVAGAVWPVVRATIAGALVAATLGAVGARAQAPAPGGDRDARGEEVLALERRIEEAVLRADVAFLDRVCADDFTYSHGDGWTTGGPILGIEGQSAWLASLSGRYALRDIDSQQVELHGDVAITMGRIRARSGAAAAPRTFSFWYVRVYAYRDGRWRYLSHRTVHGPVDEPTNDER